MAKGFEEPGQMCLLAAPVHKRGTWATETQAWASREGRARGGCVPAPLWLGVSESQWPCPGKAHGGRRQAQSGRPGFSPLPELRWAT